MSTQVLMNIVIFDHSVSEKKQLNLLVKKFSSSARWYLIEDESQDIEKKKKNEEKNYIVNISLSIDFDYSPLLIQIK